MSQIEFVSYLRVSTQKQGASGLGLDAQRASVENFVKASGGVLIDEFREVETGKGSNALAKRPTLKAALEFCRKKGATLVIAKLDRLARNVHFVSGLMESRVRFVACDMPEASELTIHIMAAFAEHEAKRVSERTKEALAIAKGRGVVLGAAGPANLKPNVEMRQEVANATVERLRPLFDGMRARNLSQRAMVAELNSVGITAPKGGTWGLTQIQRTLVRLDMNATNTVYGRSSLSNMPPDFKNQGSSWER